jgi:hypothetical protein
MTLVKDGMDEMGLMGLVGWGWWNGIDGMEWMGWRWESWLRSTVESLSRAAAPKFGASTQAAHLQDVTPTPTLHSLQHLSFVSSPNHLVSLQSRLASHLARMLKHPRKRHMRPRHAIKAASPSALLQSAGGPVDWQATG